MVTLVWPRKNVLLECRRTRSSIIVFSHAGHVPLNKKPHTPLNRPSAMSSNQKQTHPACKPQVTGAQDVLQMGFVIPKNEKAQIQLRLEADKSRRSTLMEVHGIHPRSPQLHDNVHRTLTRQAKYKESRKVHGRRSRDSRQNSAADEFFPAWTALYLALPSVRYFLCSLFFCIF